MPVLVKSACDCVLGDHGLWNLYESLSILAFNIVFRGESLSYSDREDAVVYIVIMNLAGDYSLADFVTTGSNVLVDDG
jgi:hypothetical protein